MSICRSCRSRELFTDNVTGGTVCSSCGIVQDFDDYQHTFGGISGPEGTFVRVGSSGTGTEYSYRERKLNDSNRIIEDITFRLSFSDTRIREVKAMVEKVTDGEFGLGHVPWPLAKQAFDEAISELDGLGEDSYKDSKLIM